MNIDRPLDDLIKESLAAKRAERTVRRKETVVVKKKNPVTSKPKNQITNIHAKANTNTNASMDIDSRPKQNDIGMSLKRRGGIAKKRRPIRKRSSLGHMELDVSRKPQGSDDNSSQPPRGAGRNVPNSALQKNRGRAVKVVVSNLHPGVTQTDIAELFETVGPLKNATLSRYPNGSSSCEAEVIFENMPDALEAIKRYNLVPLDNQPLQITLVTTRTGKGRRGGGNQKKAGLRVEENSYNDQPNSPETGNGYNDQPSSPMNDRGNGGAQGGRGGRNPRRRRKRYTERRPANDGGNDRGDRGEGNDRDMYDD